MKPPGARPGRCWKSETFACLETPGFQLPTSASVRKLGRASQWQPHAIWPPFEPWSKLRFQTVRALYSSRDATSRLHFQFLPSLDPGSYDPSQAVWTNVLRLPVHQGSVQDVGGQVPWRAQVPGPCNAISGWACCSFRLVYSVAWIASIYKYMSLCQNVALEGPGSLYH